METVSYTIYTKPGCSYCDKVKELLKDVKPEPIYIDCAEYLVDETSKTNFLQFIQVMAQLPEPYKTFPMVFCNNKFIGGFTQTKIFQESYLSFSEEDF
jgi:glutaredoxin